MDGTSFLIEYIAFRAEKIYLQFPYMDFIAALIEHFILKYSYLAVFSVLLWCGVGFPMPEDIILISGGFLVYKDTANLYWMALVALSGVMIGDIIIYYIGRKFGPDIINHRRFKKILSEKRLMKIEKLFNRYGTNIVFFGRFTAFVRTPIFLSCGALGLRLSTFLIYDFIAALVSIPFFILIGFYFGKEIERATKYIHDARLLILALILMAVFYILRMKRAKPKKNKGLKKKHQLSINSSKKHEENLNAL